MQKINSDELREWLARFGVSQADFARALGVNPQTVQHWLNRKQVALEKTEDGYTFMVEFERTPEARRNAFLRAYNFVSDRENRISSGHRPLSSTTAVSWINESTAEYGPILRQPSLAPVVGRVRGGDNGYIINDDDKPPSSADEFVEYRGRDKDAFGLRVIGDSMAPRYNHGEYIVACPNLVCSIGKYVYVATKNDRKMVKRLSAEMPDAYRLESINPTHAPITLLKSEVDAIYVVQGPFDADAIIHR